MSVQKMYIGAKKVHNLLMWFVVILGLWMMFSGYVMHHELEGTVWLSDEGMRFVRVWHNGASQYFLVALLLQMVTGVIMWAVPKILQRRGPVNP